MRAKCLSILMQVDFTGVYIVPYNLIFFPTIIFYNLDFHPQIFNAPSLLTFFPTALILKGKGYSSHFPFFQRFIFFPTSLILPALLPNLIFFPRRPKDLINFPPSPSQGGGVNFIHSWYFIWDFTGYPALFSVRYTAKSASYVSYIAKVKLGFAIKDVQLPDIFITFFVF